MTEPTINLIYQALQYRPGSDLLELHDFMQSKGFKGRNGAAIPSSTIGTDLSELERYKFAVSEEAKPNAKYFAVKRNITPQEWMAKTKKRLLFRKIDGKRVCQSTLERKLMGAVAECEMLTARWNIAVSEFAGLEELVTIQLAPVPTQPEETLEEKVARLEALVNKLSGGEVRS